MKHRKRVLKKFVYPLFKSPAEMHTRGFPKDKKIHAFEKFTFENVLLNCQSQKTLFNYHL